MFNKRHFALSKITIWFSFFAMVLGYQNCSPGFEILRLAGPVSNGEVPAPSDENTVLQYQFPEIPSERISENKMSGMTGGDGVNVRNFWQFAPKYPLFSYGASKRRWIYLPPNTKIENANPDAWSYPKGTVFWKEFSLEGKRIETRVFEKISDGIGIASWRSLVYLWRVDQSDADLLKVDDFYSLPASGQSLYQAGVMADRYRLVSLSQCLRCHTGTSDAALGFNYFQLSNEFLSRNVIALSQKGLLTNAVQKYDEILGSSAQKDALGYIQSNCAHCHGGNGPGPHNFRHVSTVTTIEDEALFQSNVASPGLFAAQDLAGSRLYQRISRGTMPPQTISPDSIGVEYFRLWIETIAK